MLCVSFGVTALLFISGILGATFFPIEITPSSHVAKEFIQPKSMEDLDRATKNTQQAIERQIQIDKKKMPAEHYSELRKQGAIVSWVSWFLAAFFLKIKRKIDLLVILSVPIIASVFNAILVIELILSTVALLFVYGIKTYMRRETIKF